MLRISKISFPGLGIGEFSVNSVAFEIFGVEIAWYALFITFGMICCITYAVLQSRKIGMTFDDVIDFALFTIPIGVIGARLYYVLSELDQYHSFKDVINIREGGLAIYGGIIAGTITVFVVSLVKKINFFAFGDCVAPGVLLAQGIGRWGNFMNGEAFGYETDWFCRMGLQNFLTGNKLMYVHPTFLYESLWNLLGVLLVYLFAKLIGKKYDGQLILLTFGWYGLGRMFIEGLRTDSLYIPGTDIRTSQALALVIFVVCLAMLIFFMIKKPAKPLYVKVNEEKPEAENAEDPIVAMVKKLIEKAKSKKGNNKENDK
jgi:phosphatidylglycerol:prolipoprotein diacylglycerol transferase